MNSLDLKYIPNKELSLEYFFAIAFMLVTIFLLLAKCFSLFVVSERNSFAVFFVIPLMCFAISVRIFLSIYGQKKINKIINQVKSEGKKIEGTITGENYLDKTIAAKQRISS